MPAFVFVTRKFPPSVGGMETLASDVWAMLRAGSDGARLVAHGGSTAGLPVFWLRAARAVLRAARRPGDVVVTGDVLMYLLLLPFARAAGLRLVTMAHGKDVVWGFPPYRWCVRRALRHAPMVLCNSAATAEQVRRAGVAADRVHVLRLGVEVPARTAADVTRARQELRDELGVAPGTHVLATVGRLVRRKGVAWFVREVLPRLEGDWVYVVAGAGPDEQAVRTAARDTGLEDRVRLLGRVPDAQRERVMAGCDVFVQPNVPVRDDMEGFGLVAVEAAVRGALVVAADLEGLQDAVADGVTGLLVPSGDAEAWRAALTDVLTDPGRAARAEAFARSCADRYDRVRMGEEMVRLLATAPVRSRPTTTERVTLGDYVTSAGDYAIYSLHVATYEWVARLVADKEVLDLGCGTGYGSRLLRERGARRVVGVDVSGEAVERATADEALAGLEFRQILPTDREPLPFPDDSFDLVCSIQVIEHVTDVDGYLREVRRVLRPGGAFVCVTPDREHRLFPRQRPWNEFHVHEYDPAELGRLLGARFGPVNVQGMTGPRRLLDHELRRYRWTRLLLYPVTFPGVPEPLRLAGLRLAKRIAPHRAGSAPEGTRAFGFDWTDVVVAPDARPSVNIVVVAGALPSVG
ncbi:Methyltransferase type 11 [Cellulomonas flavigena DSM 20109]|uniref:D-inositol 3-phosphate glycosyltransferase n=1 Tax=Cellulomonas flavigena (strain ATCC 482 / DSM 20109 / BCRC 11376 / JCM 18109 / NBRC 3775 / NCIMB 8073 / NRS 134) TaxID=446466 RepID=D5UHC7_CELFN|nr:glycosyltransferase [Cellulomonas flavigena]ADG75248.1 Methyltransferase type 11 [Cellulomonas flavigena DSM 20109]